MSWQHKALYAERDLAALGEQAAKVNEQNGNLLLLVFALIGDTEQHLPVETVRKAQESLKQKAIHAQTDDKWNLHVKLVDKPKIQLANVVPPKDILAPGSVQ